MKELKVILYDLVDSSVWFNLWEQVSRLPRISVQDSVSIPVSNLVFVGIKQQIERHTTPHAWRMWIIHD